MPKSVFAAALALPGLRSAAEPYRPLPRLPEYEVKKRATGASGSAAEDAPSSVPTPPPAAAALPSPGRGEESVHTLERGTSGPRPA